MKVQHLAVIFVIIIIPISIILSQYIQTQIDTITLQTAYISNLNNATHDALKAFQLNSINNKYSSISDSKIRDIEASINTFYNSLGVSMDSYVSSKEQLSVFIPAILYTLYDGYYIYSSYNNVYTKSGEGKDEKITIEDNRNYRDGLRPYIYYSCKYKLSSGKIIIINYTLDNAITIYGDVGDGKGYQTRSGYLINPDQVENINKTAKTLTYSDITIKPEILTEHLITIENEETGKTKEGDYRYIFYQNKKVYQDHNDSGNLLYEADGTPKIFWYDNYKKTYVNDKETKAYAKSCGMKSTSAYDYYVEAANFSQWVNTYLGNIKQSDVIKDDAGETTIGNDTDYLSINTENAYIFRTKGNNNDNDPLLSSSVFNAHRKAIIRKSIETNLTTAIANYNAQTGSNYEFVMPKIDEINWESIVNNISITSFMQGLPMGTKYFNNYSVITNTENEEVINDQSVYILTKEGNSLEYHQPGCKELIGKQDKIVGGYTALSFKRQTMKISDNHIEYFYPQARVGATTTGCYNCIVNASGDYDIDSIIAGKITNYQTNAVIYNKEQLIGVRTAYLSALARERYDLYKSNFK